MLLTLVVCGAAGGGCARGARCPTTGQAHASGSVVTYLSASSDEDTASTRIVIAEQALRAGTPLRTSLLRVVPRPASLVWDGHLRPVDLVHFAGRRLKRSIPRGGAIRRRDLTGGDPRADFNLPMGARAVTLRVDWVAGPGVWVRRGDWVDVALVAAGRGGALGRPGPRQASELSLRVLMQGARVLGSVERRTGPATWRRWCTIMALPREAQALALAQRIGRIVLLPLPQGGEPGRRASYPPVTRRDLEDPAFWRRERRDRRKTIGPLGVPDDPGIRVK